MSAAGEMADEQLLSRLLVVRHGESVAMAEGIVGGPKGCRGLTDRGHAQAAALRDRFAAGREPQVHFVYTSPLPRARETTDIVLPALGGGERDNLDVRIHDDLEEMRLGPIDGMTWEAARQQFAFVRSDGQPYTPVVPGGESRAGFRHRVAQVLNDIAASHPGATVFVGCHGGIVSAAMAMAFGIPPAQPGVGVVTAVTSITELELLDGDNGLLDGDKGRRWQVRRFNDAAHLTAVEAA
ncbi:histidine phosphatase family protein [Candidatus Poriferisodalis sp.]|uniref:histidine phosphatase family protein n=1 Tax=Candidatus Poriferisodalis sp. TaxID=3101277 RepID=UPI003D0AE4C8